jgi:hypothetical protein
MRRYGRAGWEGWTVFITVVAGLSLLHRLTVMRHLGLLVRIAATLMSLVVTEFAT